MDPVEIFGTALLAIAAAGSAIAISVGLTLTILRFISKIFFKKQAFWWMDRERPGVPRGPPRATRGIYEVRPKQREEGRK